ncbi:MAG TPA: hypothetical protein VG943_00385 [Caulobacterales bacterium]|nr:hypothetical protein [Caulobacterales bacterium]
MTERGPESPKSKIDRLVRILSFAKEERLKGYPEASAIAEKMLADTKILNELCSDLGQIAVRNPLIPRKQFLELVKARAGGLPLSNAETREIDNFAYSLLEAFGGALGSNGFVDLSALTA